MARAEREAKKKAKSTEKKAAKTERKARTPSEKAATALSNLTPLMGLATQVATAIPTLKRQPQVQGSTPGYSATSVPSGVAQQGHGMGRGPALLQSFRAAGQVGQQLAGAQAAQGFQESVVNVNNERERRQSLAKFGADQAAGLSQLAVGLVNNANARKDQRENRAGDVGTLQGMQGATPAQQGIIRDAAVQNMQNTRDSLKMPDIEELSENPYALQQDAAASVDDIINQGADELIRNKAEVFQLHRSALGLPYPDTIADMAPELEFQARKLSIAADYITKSGGDLYTMLPRVGRRLGSDILRYLNPPMQQYRLDEPME